MTVSKQHEDYQQCQRPKNSAYKQCKTHGRRVMERVGKNTAKGSPTRSHPTSEKGT